MERLLNWIVKMSEDLVIDVQGVIKSSETIFVKTALQVLGEMNVSMLGCCSFNWNVAPGRG